jgi:hypothetical protein
MRGGFTVVALMIAIVALGCDSGVVSDEGAASVPPEGNLHIVTPQDGQTMYSPTVTVTGTAPDGAEVIRDISFGPDDRTTATGGRWSMAIELDDGENLLTFRIGDDKTSSATLHVTYVSESPSQSPGESPLPIAEVTREPAPTADPAPAEPPQPKPLPVKVTRRTVSVPRNSTASVTIRTASGARCSIIVNYPSGPSVARGLEPKKANSSGTITWKWKVGGNTTKGTHGIDIECRKGDRSGSVSTSFRVR